MFIFEQRQLYSSFSICMSFISLSWLITLDRISSTMLSRCDLSRHPLSWVKRKNFWSFTTEYVSHGFFHIWPLLYWSSFLLFLICWMFVSWKCVQFFQILFFVNWVDCIYFFLHSVNVAYYNDWFTYVEPSMHPRNKMSRPV